MAVVKIPSTFRVFTAGKAELKLAGATVREVLSALVTEHPELRARLFDEAGAIRRYVNVFHNDEDIRFLQSLETQLGDKDVITLIPAMAGG